MISLSESWLAETARRTAEEEDACLVARPSWLSLEDDAVERGPTVGRPARAADETSR